MQSIHPSLDTLSSLCRQISMDNSISILDKKVQALEQQAEALKVLPAYHLPQGLGNRQTTGTCQQHHYLWY